MTMNGNGATGGNGAYPALRSPHDVEPSKLLQYLPSIYENDPFIGRFLRIFEDLHDPLRAVAGTLPLYFDALLAPPELRDFLGSWVGADHSNGLAALPPERGAALVKEALTLHRWRGTKHGLRRALELATGHTPMITDYGEGLVVGPDARLGVNTALDGGEPFRITVTFDCDPAQIDTRIVDAIIRQHKPAHVVHAVTFSAERVT